MLQGIKHLTPSEFAKFYFDFEPYSYQKEALDYEGKNLLLVWGRQTGKSTITAMRAIYAAIMNDNWTVLILAPTQRQSSRLFKKIKHFITKSAQKYPELKLVEFIERETQTLIEFANGSEINSLPIGEDGSNIRGFTANMVIIDECGEIQKSEIWSAINPMTMSTGGGQWLIGTFRGTGNQFYNIWKDPKIYKFRVFKATSKQNPNADKDQIELDKMRMPISMWMQEYECVPMEETDAFFPSALVNKIVGDYSQHEAPVPNPAYSYYLGVDPAAEGLDSTVYCIQLRTPAGRDLVVKMIEAKGQTLPQIDANIRMLHSIWNFKNIIIDSTGGRNLHEFMVLDGIPVDGMQFTLQKKQEVFSFLKQMMQGGNYSVYKCEEAVKQLLDMRYEFVKLGNSGNIKIYSGQSRDHKMPGGDDYVVAMALAMWATKLPEQPVLFSTARTIFTRNE